MLTTHLTRQADLFSRAKQLLKWTLNIAIATTPAHDTANVRDTATASIGRRMSRHGALCMLRRRASALLI